MDAIVARGADRSKAWAGLRPRVGLALALALGLAGCGAWAFEADAFMLEPASTMSEDKDRLQLQLSTSSLPRFDSIDGPSRSSRIDMTWLPPRRSALGLSLGMATVHGSALAGAGPYPGGATSLNLGLHWRYTLDSNYRIDVTAWRRVMPADTLTLVRLHEPDYGARVEMQIRPVRKSGFVADRGFIGLQLESGARVTLRRSGGKPMIYYRAKF
ncbi:MAG: hypothetical protein NDJ19_04515 [Ramlibacter sp.]|nr:hypothetical protein [Ramlibacter sp.]